MFRSHAQGSLLSAWTVHAIKYVVIVLATSTHGITSAANDAVGPNVVIIFADDLGYGDLTCYGNTVFQTPNLDRLADEGARLTNFYTSCPYCAPSRASLQTGRYHPRTGMVGNPVPKGDVGYTEYNDQLGLPPSEITIGELFQQAGYATACFGKWHLGHQPQFLPTQQGYEEYFGMLYSNDMRPVRLWEGEKIAEYPVYQASLTQRLTDRAVDFVQRHAKTPFFLYLPHIMPHKPLAASEAFYQQSGAGLYADVVHELDAGIGRLLTAIDEAGCRDNTLVFFTSDNGPWYGGSTGGLRGMKGQSWEGGYREPLLARWPGRIPAGHVSNEPAIIMDLFTTSLTAAGIAVPSDRPIDGRDIMPLLTTDSVSPHEVLYCIKGDKLAAVRAGRWKLHILPPGEDNKPDDWVDPRPPDGVTIIAPYEQPRPTEFPGEKTGPRSRAGLLFDLVADPTEQHDVAKKHPDVVKRLQAYAATITKDVAQQR